MEKISFSVVTATYNRMSTGYLESNINSLKKQKKGPFEYEHIIIDDGSSDGTGDYVKKVTRRDPRIKYVHKENSGPADSWKKGIELASGSFIIFLDDDDLLTKNSLLLRSKYILNNPGVDWFYAKAKWVDGTGNPIKVYYQSRFVLKNLYKEMLERNLIHGGTPTFRTELLKKMDWPSWLSRSQDYYILLELLRPERNLNFGFLDDYIYIYRRHENMYTNQYLKSEKLLRKKEKLNERVRSLHKSANISKLDRFKYKLLGIINL